MVTLCFCREQAEDGLSQVTMNKLAVSETPSATSVPFWKNLNILMTAPISDKENVSHGVKTPEGENERALLEARGNKREGMDQSQ